jgi:hypothetical protein
MYSFSAAAVNKNAFNQLLYGLTAGAVYDRA